MSVPQKHFLSGIPRLSCVIRLFMVASMVMERGCDAHEAGVDVLFLDFLERSTGSLNAASAFEARASRSQYFRWCAWHETATLASVSRA